MPFQSNSGLTTQVSKMLINIVHPRVPKEYMVYNKEYKYTLYSCYVWPVGVYLSL